MLIILQTLISKKLYNKFYNLLSIINDIFIAINIKNIGYINDWKKFT